MLRVDAPPADTAPRTVAGRYEVLARIGRGGMGVVHRVRDRQTERVFAMKQPSWTGPVGFSPCCDPRASLTREHLALSRLDHPHIVRLSDAGIDEAGEPFLVLELLEQARMIVDLPRAASLAQRLCALGQMFEGLAHVHRAKLVHGDVTPSNVLLCDRPAWLTTPCTLGSRVCLIDFGLAGGTEEQAPKPHLESSGPPSLVGSVLYLAPELIEGEPPSVASDLYAAGMIAAEVLTGTDPRTRTGPRTTLASLRDFPGDWLDETAAVMGRESRTAALLRRLLARDPARRSFCANEVASELETIRRAI
jgi:serine/threonine protein kinase